MNFQEAVQSVFSNYAKFRGRACRSEFWWFQLFLLLGGIVAGLLNLFANTNFLGGSPLAMLFWLATIISRSRRHGAQASRYRFKRVVDFARLDPAHRHGRVDRLVVPGGLEGLQPVWARSASAGADQADRFVAREQIKQLPQRLPARRLQFRIACEHQRRIVARRR